MIMIVMVIFTVLYLTITHIYKGLDCRLKGSGDHMYDLVSLHTLTPGFCAVR